MKNKNLFLRTVLTFFVLCAMLPFLAQANQNTRPPLYDAIYAKDFIKAKQAIELGADVNAIYDRDSMLNWALRSKNSEIIK